MQRQVFLRRAASTVLCAGLLLGAGAASAAGAATNVSASNGWVRWLPGNLPAAGYVVLENHGASNVDVVAASSPDYGSAMMHQSVHNGSTDTMVMVERLTVPAHGKAAFSPSGYHLMLEQATHRIAPGDTVHLTLDLSDGTHLAVPMIVSPATRTQ